MKEELRRILSTEASPSRGTRLVREYLQWRILGMMQNQGAMMPLAFCGGTALRFIYGLQRFSEDLDFSIVRREKSFSFRGYAEEIVHAFEREGYTVEPKWSKPERSVQGVMLRFRGLLSEVGLPFRENQSLSIRVEADTNPPEGAGTEISIVRRMHLLRIQHLDKPSLLAGKLHAVLTREFTKGRDFYDLAWYLANPDWPAPNMLFLRNALEQTGWTKNRIDSLNLPEELRNRFESVNWQAVHRDVLPFLERPEEVNLLNSKDMTSLIDRLK